MKAKISECLGLITETRAYNVGLINTIYCYIDCESHWLMTYDSLTHKSWDLDLIRLLIVPAFSYSILLWKSENHEN